MHYFTEMLLSIDILKFLNNETINKIFSCNKLDLYLYCFIRSLGNIYLISHFKAISLCLFRRIEDSTIIIPLVPFWIRALGYSHSFSLSMILFPGGWVFFCFLFFVFLTHQLYTIYSTRAYCNCSCLLFKITFLTLPSH